MIKLEVNHQNHQNHSQGKAVDKGVLSQKLSESTQQNKSVLKSYIKASPLQSTIKDYNNQTNLHAESSGRSIHPKKEVLSSSVDKELKTIENIKAQSKNIKKTVEELIEEYKSDAEKLLINHGYDPQKQIQIKKQLEKLQKQKAERRLRIQKHVNKLEEEKKKDNKGEDKTELEIEEKRLRIQKKLIEIKERQQRRQIQEEKFIQFYQNYKSMKPKHKVMEEEFNEREQKEREEKITKNQKKNKELFKPMNLSELEGFQEDYQNKKYEQERFRLQNKIYERKKNEENQKKLEQLYRGHCHEMVSLQNENHLRQKRQAVEKQNRIKEYSSIIKEQFMPRIVRSSFSEEDQDNQLNLLRVSETERRSKKVTKDRYLKGQYQGKVLFEQKVPLTQVQQHRKGLEYLQFLKGLPKKMKTVEVSEIQPAASSKKKYVMEKIERNQNPLYRRKNKHHSIDFTTIKNTDELKSALSKFRTQNEEIELEEKVVKYKNHQNMLELQEQSNKVNNKIIENIQQKLSLLAKFQ